MIWAFNYSSIASGLRKPPGFGHTDLCVNQISLHTAGKKYAFSWEPNQNLPPITLLNFPPFLYVISLFQWYKFPPNVKILSRHASPYVCIYIKSLNVVTARCSTTFGIPELKTFNKVCYCFGCLCTKVSKYVTSRGPRCQFLITKLSKWALVIPFCSFEHFAHCWVSV